MDKEKIQEELIKEVNSKQVELSINEMSLIINSLIEFVKLINKSEEFNNLIQSHKNLIKKFDEIREEQLKKLKEGREKISKI